MATESDGIVLATVTWYSSSPWSIALVPQFTANQFILSTGRSLIVRQIKQSTAATVMFFMRDSYTGRGRSSLNSGVNSQSITIIASKNGASGTTITPTITDLGSSLGAGWYSMALTTSHTDTIGEMVFHITAPNALDNDEIKLFIVAIDPTDLAQGLFVVGTVVTDGGNSATTFVTNLTQTSTDHWKYSFVVFTSGTLKEQVQQVTAYNGTTKAVSFRSPGFSATPTAGDTFYLINK